MSARITFDSLTLSAVIDSLQPLLHGRIQHISQPTEHEIVLKVYSHAAGEVRWLINCSAQWARTHLITQRPVNPPQPPNFCMALRKYLEGGQVVSLVQRRFDRILDLEVRGFEGKEYLLSVELMGKHSNIILIGSDDRIINAAKQVSAKVNRVREILPGRPYLPPPSTLKPDPRKVTRDQFLDWLQAQRPEDMVIWLRNQFDGMSPLLVQEIAKRAENLAAAEEVLNWWDAFNSVFAAARESTWQPVLLRGADAEPLGSYPLRLASLTEVTQESQPDINLALEKYFNAAVPRAEVEQMRRSLQGALQKTLAIRDLSLDQVRHGTQESGRAADYRRWGELLLANLYQLQSGKDKAEVLDYYADPPETIPIRLDPLLTVQQNVERYFQRARHVDSNAQRLQELKQRLETETQELRAARAEVDAVTEKADLEKLRDQATQRGWLLSNAPQTVGKVETQKPEFEGKRIRSFTSPDGWQVLVGENAEANDYLVRQVAQQNDWWLHVRAGTSAHVLIRTGNAPQRVPPSTLHFAAQLAAANSPGKHSSLVAVDYTLRKHVRRPRGAAPGFVTYTQEKTLDVKPTESTR